MKEKLNQIILKEKEALNSLLLLLDKQYQYIVKNDVFGMDAVVKDIESCNILVAESEMERRKLTQGRDMSGIIFELKDEILENNSRSLVKLLHETILQKDTNELLIRQRLGFTTQMLNIFNPDKSAKTYNSYGKRR